MFKFVRTSFYYHYWIIISWRSFEPIFIFLSTYRQQEMRFLTTPVKDSLALIKFILSLDNQMEVFGQPRSQGFSLLVGGARPPREGKSPGNEVGFWCLI